MLRRRDDVESSTADTVGAETTMIPSIIGSTTAIRSPDMGMTIMSPRGNLESNMCATTWSTSTHDLPR